MLRQVQPGTGGRDAPGRQQFADQGGESRARQIGRGHAPQAFAFDADQVGRAFVLTRQRLEQALFQLSPVRFRVAEQQLAIAMSQLASLTSRVSAAKASVDAGAMVKSDLLLAQIALAQAEQGVLQLTALRDGAYRRLGLAIGNGGAAVRPDGVDPRPLREAPDADMLVQAALERRPELIAAEDHANAARQSARATSMMRLPTINAIGAYQHQTGQGVFAEPDVGYVGATLDWPVFTWGKAMNAARAAASNAGLQRELLEASVGVEVRSRVDTLNTAIAGLKVGEIIVEQALENLHIQEARQGAGGATMQEVLDAELTLVRARSSKASAEFTARRAAAALERAVGGDPWTL